MLGLAATTSRVAELEVEREREHDDQHCRHPYAPVAPDAGVRDVHAVVARDQRGTAMIAAQLVTFFMTWFWR